LGEAKIVGEKIIFNITPSPGASTCLGNAFDDTIKLMDFFNHKFTFRKEVFEKDLILLSEFITDDISVKSKTLISFQC